MGENRLTPAKRHISVPMETSVSNTSSATHVTIFFPSGVMATGPAVCNGAIERAFLKLYRNQ